MADAPLAIDAGDDAHLARMLAAWPRLSAEDRERLAGEAERLADAER